MENAGTVKVVIISLFLGVLLGMGVGLLRFYAWGQTHADLAANLVPVQDVSPETLAVKIPAVEVDGVKDFGYLPEGKTEASHDFVVQNTGTGVLQLQEISSSCQCTVASLPKKELGPGESMKVRVKVSLHGTSGDFHETVTFFTNDPKKPEIQLQVRGIITVPVWVDALEVNVGRILENAPGYASVCVYDRAPEPVEVTDIRFRDTELAAFFEAKTQALTEEDVKKADEEASHGTKILITVKPGLPQGAFQQVMLIRTSSPDQKDLRVRIHGIVGNQITIFGRGWNEDAGTLTLENIPRGTELTRKLMIHARGADFAAYHFSLKDVFPAFVNVEVSPPRIMEGTDISVTELTITIPADAPECNYLTGSFQEMGYIVLETGKEEPPLRIYLRFMVIQAAGPGTSISPEGTHSS